MSFDIGGGDMTRTGEYRIRASDCLALAEVVSDPLERLELQHIAGAYMRLAERNEDRDRQDQPNVREAEEQQVPALIISVPV